LVLFLWNAQELKVRDLFSLNKDKIEHIFGEARQMWRLTALADELDSPVFAAKVC
jgi:hypothetical protein